MGNTGINLVKCKETNRALLLQLICTSGKITRTELTNRSQLSPMTISNIVNEFLAQKLIIECPLKNTTKTPGRTPTLLQISPEAPLLAGIRMTNTHLYGIIGDLSLNPVVQKELALDTVETETSLLNKLHSFADSLFAMIDRPILGLGISAGGVINRKKGSIQYIANFFNINHLDIADHLSQFYSFPVYVCDEIQSASLCELYFGHGKTNPSFLYVGVTYGIAAAVIFEHNLQNFCGELGHMSINSHGPKCTCGSNGCLEMYCSTTSIIQQIAHETGTLQPDMAHAVQYCLSNRNAYAILHNAMRQLAYGINNYLNLYSVPTVVLGHDAFYLPDDIIEGMENMVAEINVSMRYSGAHPKFVKSKLGISTQLLGSLCIVLQELFQDISAFNLLNT